MAAVSKRTKQQGRYDGPFEIESFDPASNAYKLRNIDGSAVKGARKSHELLKKFEGDLSDSESDEDEDVYEVTRVDDVRTTEDGQEYLVKWKGYDDKEWEHADNLKNAGRVLELFWKKRNEMDELKHQPWRKS